MTKRTYLLLLAFILLITSGYAQDLPALIPQPKTLHATGGSYTLPATVTIAYTADSLQASAERTATLLGQDSRTTQGDAGDLLLETVEDYRRFAHREAYELSITHSGMRITARTLRGLTNGIMTLTQLLEGGDTAPCVAIQDEPAFGWRGYMVDVGRNYQRMELLKQQIDAMALLKLNVFHFHMTEDVAWRLAIKQYPQLTDPRHMTRDQGLFYDEADIRELMAYCAERGILFLPEIDMPGHSAAFKRAMGVDMQSPEGLQIVLNILEEVMDTYHFTHFHIGADEVKIKNEDFVPTITAYLESRGVTVMGWQPGGNYPASVWRQLWSDDTAHTSDQVGARQVDSRNLYINHIDALETVPLIYNHMICDVPSETALKKGATLCLWNDRRLRRGEDNLTHNAVLPAMMAFGERSWRGGGKTGNYVGVDTTPQHLSALNDLEQRMMDLRATFLPHFPFPYTPQADVEWAIFGPYPNGGELTKSFPIEEADAAALEAMTPDTTLVGGTIILRHFWHPTIKGHYTDLKPDHTFYAYRRIYSDRDRVMPTWITFYDYSRSQQAHSPLPGEWNRTHATLWVNDTEIAPPKWLRAGQKGNLEIPYEDENYIMRAPYPIPLKKGWNTVLIKAPMGTFQAPAWYYPYKWMFTFIEAPAHYHP